MSTKQDSNIDKAASIVETLGKAFETGSALIGALKVAGFATLGLASVVSTGIVPIVVAGAVGGITLAKYAHDKYKDSHMPQNKPDDTLKPLTKRLPKEHDHHSFDDIRTILEKSGSLSVVNEISKKLTELGVTAKNKPIEYTKSQQIQKQPSLPAHK